MVKPLASDASTLQFLESLAVRKYRAATSDTSHAKESLAREYGFDDWGELTQHARNCCVLLDRSTMEFTRTLQTALPTAWKFITEAEELSAWMFETKLELRVGGRFEFPTWGGSIGKLEASSCIRFVADEGGYSEFQIEPLGQHQTLARIIDYLPAHLEVPQHVKNESDKRISAQPGGPGTHWAGVLAGWHNGSDSLEAHARNEQPRTKYGPLALMYSDLLDARHQDNSR